MPTDPLIVLDGPVGTELLRRGLAGHPTGWTAFAARDAPTLLWDVHAAYAAAGATVHTANTFRTTAAAVGSAWIDLAARSVALARAAVPADHRIAGAIAPVADCYRPDLSPTDARTAHRRTARTLARCGVDLLLCETFPHVGEALVCVEEAVATGRPTWVAFTAGPTGDLLTPAQVREGARAAVDRGASAVLVNCTPVAGTSAYVLALTGLGVPFGAYANAGAPTEGVGWDASTDEGAARYAAHAREWRSAGASILGSCCGTGPAHIAAIAAIE